MGHVTGSSSWILTFFFHSLCTDYEEDEWPEVPGLAKYRTTPRTNGSATETSTLKRFAVRKKSDQCLYNMAALLASVGAGFDIRVSNSSGVHPHLSTANNEEMDEESTPVHRSSKPDVFVGQRRDAYLAAVRDSFIEPLDDETSPEFMLSPPPYAHHTYHGVQTKFRPSVNFDNIPIRFTESYDCYTSDGQPTPSSDNRTTPSADSSQPSGATSFSGSLSPRLYPDSANDLALISLSPSTDEAFHVYQRQMSDSSSVFETPKTTPKTTPSHHSVKFEDNVRGAYGHRRSPSNTSASSIPTPSPLSAAAAQQQMALSDLNVARHASDSDYDHTPRGRGLAPIKPPPTRRQHSHERATAERPVTLDIIPRPRPVAGILKKTSSPQHLASHASPVRRVDPDEGLARSSASPGSTPPHIEHHKTLLDIDMEGQREDSTRPLPAKVLPRAPTISELEQEFLK